ncbi:hypothetical protein [Palleronia caenipelagi]|uniref:Uncharacterized protein n=1 Tax=Palleronia caenipelagi TaxID=2489174 RepID=A0A547Q2H1_9RHOB|nr:hypothetical protein [Palleronia caenipelagi]TRD20586.1 hypothetical protein FEV53_09810 [Palleronia caenipelagi]
MQHSAIEFHTSTHVENAKGVITRIFSTFRPAIQSAKGSDATQDLVNDRVIWVKEAETRNAAAFDGALVPPAEDSLMILGQAIGGPDLSPMPDDDERVALTILGGDPNSDFFLPVEFATTSADQSGSPVLA